MVSVAKRYKYTDHAALLSSWIDVARKACDAQRPNCKRRLGSLLAAQGLAWATACLTDSGLDAVRRPPDIDRFHRNPECSRARTGFFAALKFFWSWWNEYARSAVARHMNTATMARMYFTTRRTQFAMPNDSAVQRRRGAVRCKRGLDIR